VGEDDKTVVGRVAAILDAVAEASAPVPLAELTRLTGIPKPTVRRIAASLVARGILGRTEAGYVPGGKMLRYGLHAMSRHPVALAVQPYLQDLHQRSMGEMAWFATAEAGELTVAVLLDASRPPDLAARGDGQRTRGHQNQVRDA